MAIVAMHEGWKGFKQDFWGSVS